MSRWRERKGLRGAILGYAPLPQAGYWARRHPILVGEGRKAATPLEITPRGQAGGDQGQDSGSKVGLSRNTVYSDGNMLCLRLSHDLTSHTRLLMN